MSDNEGKSDNVSDKKKVIKRSIRITSEQDENWDPSLIRDLLSGDYTLVQNILMSDINAGQEDQNVGQKSGSTQMSDNNTESYKACCKQLISLFDKIFKLKFPVKIIDMIAPILDQEIDEKIIDEVRKNLELES